MRSMCARKRSPSPAPSLAPSIRPGMSASTTCPSSSSITPRFGSRVVKGYGAIFGRARVKAASSDDLPAFGRPTSPTSARSFSLRSSQRSSPGRPLLGEARRLPRRALEAGVAAAAVAAAGDDQLLALDREVADQAPSVVAHLGARPAPGRGRLRRWRRGGARRCPCPPAAARTWGRVVEGVEVAHLARGDEHDVAAASAVTAVGSAARDVLLAAEADAAVAAASAAHTDPGPVGEHGEV